MAKTLVDLDPELLDAAAAALGTRTKKDTVMAALRAAVAADAQRRELALLAAGELADQAVLTRVRDAAWQR
jgi:Arc/MetJ family transcription regulator